MELSNAGGNYAIYQFLLWICSYSKFFEVTGSIFLSAWGVRSFVFFFHCLCWPLYVSCQSTQHCILRYQFSPWVFTWEMVVCSSGTHNRVIFPVHGFGFLKEGIKLYFTRRGHIFTTDTWLFRLLLLTLFHHVNL